MKIHLVRRWGQHQAGSVVDVKTTQGVWLVRCGFGVKVNPEPAPAAQPEPTLEQAPKKRAVRRSASPAASPQDSSAPAHPTPTPAAPAVGEPKRRARRKTSSEDS